MKIVIGNAIFAVIVGGVYLYAAGDMAEFRSGVILAGVAYLVGVIYGSIIRGAPKQPSRPRRVSSIDTSAFDHIA